MDHWLVSSLQYSPFMQPALLLVLGMLAQWLAWRLHMPSILFLLLAGLLAGHFGWLNPDRLLGDLLKPVVGFSVGLILFEGSLSLRLEELRQSGQVVWRLITTGTVVTWILASLAGWLLLDFSPGLAILLGAILTVTGPTVVLPLLDYVKPTGKAGHILKWEGILIDPVGAMLAVFVFETLLNIGSGTLLTQIVMGVLKTITLSAVIGLTSGLIFNTLIERRLIPEFLQNPMALTAVLATYAIANLVQQESGLVAVTVMGVMLANRRQSDIRNIVQFKEDLRVLLLSVLFVMLAARLDIDNLMHLGKQALWFAGLLIFIIRPFSVWLCTRNSELSWQEKTYLACIAPRGIVAASVSAVFALELSHAGYFDADRLSLVVFLVILCTVAFYSLLAKPLAGWLKLRDDSTQQNLL